VLRELILKIIAGIAGIWLASEFVSGVMIIDSWQIFVWAGLILGLINYFIKPILNFIALPLRILTLGLFSLVINMGIIWVVDYFFDSITIQELASLFWTTLIVWLMNIILPKFFPKKRKLLENA